MCSQGVHAQNQAMRLGSVPLEDPPTAPARRSGYGTACSKDELIATGGALVRNRQFEPDPGRVESPDTRTRRHDCHTIDSEPHQLPPLLEVRRRPVGARIGVQDDAPLDGGVRQGVKSVDLAFELGPN